MKEYLLLKQDYPEEMKLEMNFMNISLEMRAEKVFLVSEILKGVYGTPVVHGMHGNSFFNS